ncbi:hypothetical protein KPL47_06990 [Clostridium estertheticum]|uniref:hypothetical protein n=1 Tax=Clostridium estertheticum TaxID=238834 RepID=UPI001C0BA086|nr:hypothetical protein [Clostridium estertheticum]MBU3176113.1 hypothetical protein [Clostridium estertheticum]
MIIRNNEINKFGDNYYTRNRKLKLEEYDDNGNLIDTIEFAQGDLWNFYQTKNNNYNDFTIARKKDREHFKGKELVLMKRIMDLVNDYYFGEDTIKDIETIFKEYTVEEIEFALSFKNYAYNESTYNFAMKEYFKIKNMSFYEILKWIKDCKGIYYAVSNDNVKGMAYLEMPTKKQAKYQRQSNSKRIVFLNFRDWKEYIVNETELC